MAQNTPDTEAYAAFRKLWSPYDWEAREGKEEILQIGSVAIEPLVSILLDLIDHHHPRFPIGKGEEGKRLIEEYWKADPDESFERLRKIARLSINQRLMTDTVYLLGKLRAEAAIPVLLKLIVSYGMLHGPDGDSHEMLALFRIGPPVIPHLVREIEEAYERSSHSNPFVGYGFTFEMGNDNDGDEVKVRGKTNQKRGDKRIAYRIQRRAVRILGELGDPQVLPVLENLLKEMKGSLPVVVDDALFIRSEQLQLIDALEGAIKTIRNDPEQPNEPGIPQVKQIHYRWQE